MIWQNYKLAKVARHLMGIQVSRGDIAADNPTWVALNEAEDKEAKAMFDLATTPELKAIVRLAVYGEYYELGVLTPKQISDFSS